MYCPCGSKLAKNDCCITFIEGKKTPASPEQLMRSRYTAYALKNSQYIYDTYAKSNRIEQSVDEIRAWASQTKWLKLTIIECSEFNSLPDNINVSENLHTDNVLPTVKFSATYIYDNTLFTMQEESRFTIEDGQWRYIDGNFTSDDGNPLPNRNEACPCGSHKKFKRCCGK